MVTEDYLLGNGRFHDHFFVTVEILAKLVSRAPAAVSIAQLEEATGRQARELARKCNALSRAGLIRQEAGTSRKWVLNCDISRVTLEDVFRCVSADQPGRSSARAAPERSPNDVDVLVMQAVIAINQNLCKQLRLFSLDRLKASAGGMFPARSRQFSDAPLDDGCDTPASGIDVPVLLAM